MFRSEFCWRPFFSAAVLVAIIHVGAVENLKHVASCCSIKAKVPINSGYIFLVVDLAHGAKGRSFPRRVNGQTRPSCGNFGLGVAPYQSYPSLKTQDQNHTWFYLAGGQPMAE